LGKIEKITGYCTIVELKSVQYSRNFKQNCASSDVKRPLRHLEAPPHNFHF